MSSIFSGIKDAKVSPEGNYFKHPSHVWVEVHGVKIVKKFTGEQFVAIEVKVVRVLDEDTPHKVGEDVTHLLKVSSPSFLGNFKGFVCAALGCEPDEVDQAAADRVTSDEQPLSGIVLEVTAREITTRAGNPFTKVTYKREVPPEEVAGA